MIEKYRAGTIPDGPPASLDTAGLDAVHSYSNAMDALDLRGGAEAAWSLVTAANQFIVQAAPWTLAKQQKEVELDQTLAALARCLIRLAVLIQPFMPGKAAELWGHLGQDAAISGAWQAAEHPRATGARVRKPDGLFPKPILPSP
jgi:methionyl-tRNA synthetase